MTWWGVIDHPHRYCLQCGALVVKQKLHTKWHRKNEGR